MHKRQVVLTEQTQLLLLISLSINLLPFFSVLTLWFMAICALVIVWQWAIYRKLVGEPKGWMKSLIAISGCILLITSGKSLGLLAGMIHLLCLSFILKPLELRRRADFYQFVVLALLLTSTALIFQQSIYFAVFMLLIFLLNISLLISYFNVAYRLQTVVRFAGKLFAQSLPLAIALFLLFPKISPFWQVPQAKSAETGLSDSLTIGDISKLALSNELAFRAEFEGRPPEHQKLYWRALVLEKFDGKSWQRKYTQIDRLATFAQVKANQHTPLSDAAQLIRYQIIQETSHQPWLFVLDLGQPANNNALRNIMVLDDYSLFLKDGVNKPVAYQLVSDLTAKLNLYESSRDLRYNTDVNASSNPRLHQYGVSLKARFGSKREIIGQVLQDFSQQGYRYTLEPPAIPDNSLDTFYFETQAGFCEHYASSFTYLMRAAGIPARVVLGYMGGTYSQQGQYFRVLQREAHAWSEVWIKDQGWVRVDPTAAVDPSRVSQGFSSSLLEEQKALANFNFRQWLSGAVFDKLKFYVDLLDYQWTKAVINYSSEQQFNLLKNWFGQHFKLAAILAIFATLALVVSLYFINKWLQRRKKSPCSPYVKLYDQMLNTLAKHQICKNNHESDIEFIARLKGIDQNLANQVAIVNSCFNRGVYSQTDVIQQDIDKMRRALSQIKQLTANLRAR